MPGLIRLILLGILIGVGLSFFRKFQRNRLRWQDRGSVKRNRQKTAAKKTVQCEYCGVYVPEEEAVRDGDHVFCSKRHRLAHKS